MLARPCLWCCYPAFGVLDGFYTGKIGDVGGNMTDAFNVLNHRRTYHSVLRRGQDFLEELYCSIEVILIAQSPFLSFQVQKRHRCLQTSDLSVLQRDVGSIRQCGDPWALRTPGTVRSGGLRKGEGGHKCW